MEDETIQIVPQTARQAIIWIRVIDGPHRGSEWSFQHPTTANLGRGLGANLRLPNETFLSRVHCEFRIAPPNITVRDVSRRNGILVNGMQVLEATLHHGDTISTGETSIRIEVIQQSNNCDSNSPSKLSSSQLEIKAKVDPMKTRIRDEKADYSLRPNADVDIRMVATEVHEPTPPVSASSSSDAYPERIGPYRLNKLAGRGGMGVVYQAEHVGNKRLVAIKLLNSAARSNENQVQLFAREASLLIRLQHPRIVRAIEFGSSEFGPHLVMEWLDTIDIVSQLDARKGRRRIRGAAWLACRVLEGLSFIHSQDIVHRDIKISNVLAYIEAGKAQLKLGDFGLAKNHTDANYTSLTREGDFRGTIAYTAPEQFRDAKFAMPQSDLYSVAVCVFRVLTGKLPFQDWTFEQIARWMEHPMPHKLPQASDDLPENFLAILRRGLSCHPANRFSTATEMHKEFSTWL